MLKSFDIHSFRPHRITPSFPIQSGDKIVSIEVEVVKAPSNYNILLGHSWMYAMTNVVFSVFHLIFFPHDGNIITIDQLSFYRLYLAAALRPNVIFIVNYVKDYESVGMGMYLSLMGTFYIPPTISYIDSIHVYAFFLITTEFTTKEHSVMSRPQD